MARVHGKDVDYSINGVSIEGDMDEIRLRFDVAEAEITSFDDAYGNFLAGKPTAVEEIRGTLDMDSAEVDDTIFGLIGGGPVSTIFDPTGAGPGASDPQYKSTASSLTGALVSRYRLSVPVGDRASWEATIQHSGPTTRAVA